LNRPARPITAARAVCLLATPGNTADCVMAESCVSLNPRLSQLLADKGYDTDAFRAFLKANNVSAIIPGKSNRKKRARTTSKLTKAVTSSIATRYDKLARNSFSALCFVAMLAYWLRRKLSPNPLGEAAVRQQMYRLYTSPRVAGRHKPSSMPA